MGDKLLNLFFHNESTGLFTTTLITSFWTFFTMLFIFLLVFLTTLFFATFI